MRVSYKCLVVPGFARRILEHNIELKYRRIQREALLCVLRLWSGSLEWRLCPHMRSLPGSREWDQMVDWCLIHRWQGLVGLPPPRRRHGVLPPIREGREPWQPSLPTIREE